MTCLDDPWHEGFLPKLFNLCVVDLRESFCSARLVVEPLSGYGVRARTPRRAPPQLRGMACLSLPVGPPSGGGVVADLGGVVLIHRSSVHQGAWHSRAGRASPMVSFGWMMHPP